MPTTANFKAQDGRSYELTGEFRVPHTGEHFIPVWEQARGDFEGAEVLKSRPGGMTSPRILVRPVTTVDPALIKGLEDAAEALGSAFRAAIGSSVGTSRVAPYLTEEQAAAVTYGRLPVSLSSTMRDLNQGNYASKKPKL